MKHQTMITEFMTHSPHTINAGMPLATARQMMHKFGIRHLPVQVGGHLVGVLSERDIFLGTALDRDGLLLVDDVMTPEPFTVSQNANLGEVVEEMATHRYGCAVVCNGKGRVTGIFTAIDGLRSMADKLNTQNRKADFAKGNIA